MNWDLWYVSLVGDQQPQLLFGKEYHEQQLRFSPDGDLIAYPTNKEDGHQVFVRSSRSFPDLGDPIRVSPKGGTDPRWSHDGSRLFFKHWNNDVSSVSIAGNHDSILIGEPVKKAELDRAIFSGDFDVSPENSHILAIRKDVDVQDDKAIEQSPVDPYTINVVVNWFSELNEKVPVSDAE